ncbi:hypothetical protein ABH931_005131 [Streptacidiphilus sp. MAP12-33]
MTADTTSARVHLAELVDHAAAHGIRLNVRPHQSECDAPDSEAAAEGPA